MADHIDAGGPQDHPDQQKAQDGPRARGSNGYEVEEERGKLGGKLGKQIGNVEENWGKTGGHLSFGGTLGKLRKIGREMMMFPPSKS